MGKQRSAGRGLPAGAVLGDEPVKRTFRDALKTQGITVVWFAHEMGVNPSTVRGWDRQTAVTFGTAPKWAWVVLETWQKFPEAYAWQKARSTYSRSRRGGDRRSAKAVSARSLELRA